MRFKITLTILLVITMLLLAGRVYAQSLGDTIPDQLPADPNAFLDWLNTALIALVGLVSTRVVTALQKLTWIPAESRSRISGPLADLVAAVTAELCAALFAYATLAVGWLDTSGFWAVLVWAWPSAKAWYEAQQFVRIRQLATNA